MSDRMIGSSLNQQLREAVLALGVKEDQLAGLDGADLQRYLRARNGSVVKAAKMLAASCKWRVDMSIATLSADEFSTELAGGRMYVAGCDAEGHSVLITRKRSDGFRPGESATQYLRFLAYSLETAVHTMQSGQESWIWIMDLAGYSRANSPPLSISLSTLRVLADHYPERLHKCFMVDAPAVFSYLWAALSPFIDAKTRGKVTFINSKDYQSHIAAAITAAATSTAISGTAAVVANSDAAAADVSTQQHAHNHAHPVQQLLSEASAASTADGNGPTRLAHGCAAQAVAPSSAGLDTAFLAVLPFYAEPYNEASYRALLQRVWPAKKVIAA